MASVNKVIIVGNLGRDPEVRTFPSGDRVANVTIATTDRWKDKQSGELKEATEWHRVVFNGRLADIAAEHADAARAKGQAQRIEQDRFAGTGFAGEHGQPLLERDIELLDQDDVTNGKGSEHGPTL